MDISKTQTWSRSDHGQTGDTIHCDPIQILQVDNPVAIYWPANLKLIQKMAIVQSSTILVGIVTCFCFISYVVFYLWNSLQSSLCGIFYSLDFMYLYNYMWKGPSQASFLFGALDLPMTIILCWNRQEKEIMVPPQETFAIGCTSMMSTLGFSESVLSVGLRDCPVL